MPATSGASRASVGSRGPARRAPGTEPTTRPAPRRRFRVSHARGAAAAISVMMLIFGAVALFNGYVPFSLSPRPEPTPGFRDDAAFGKARIGEIVFTNGRGDTCHKVEFHNDTGLLGRDVKVRCEGSQGEDPTAVAPTPGANAGRLLSVRDAFIKR